MGSRDSVTRGEPMNVVGATYTSGTVLSWELARGRGVIRSDGESAADVLADGDSFSDFAVTPHAGLPVRFVATRHAGVLRAVDVRPALETL